MVERIIWNLWVLIYGYLTHGHGVKNYGFVKHVHIQVAVNDAFDRLLGLGFLETFMQKNQQDKDKAIAHIGCTVFLFDLVLRAHQLGWC